MKFPLTLITLLSFTLPCSIVAMNAYEQALIKAAELNHGDVMAPLLTNGTSANCANENGATPLHTAAGCGNKGIVQMLLNNGANIDAKDNKSRTPLFFAALKDHVEIAELLLKTGANPQVEDNEGRYFWMYASDNMKKWRMKQLGKEYSNPSYGSDAIDELLK